MLRTLNIPDTFSVPQAFRDAHYCLGDVLRLLDIPDDAEWEFWALYKAGKVPPGVWLPAETRAVCWRRDIIDNWLAAGCPAMPGVEAHERAVYDALLKAVSAENPQAARLMFGRPEGN